MPTALVLLLGVLLHAPAPPADSMDAPSGAGRSAAGPGVQVQPRLSPLYSANFGLGVAVGATVENAGWAGSQIAVDTRLQARYQDATVAVFTGDPYHSRVYGLVAASGSTTGRRRYYGLGPNTLTANELYLSHDAVSIEGRVGLYPFRTTALVVQPGLRFLYDRSGGVNGEDSEIPLSTLDPASQAAVAVAADQSRYGLSAGVGVATDLRDDPGYTRSGTFALVEARRFVALDGSDLQLNRLSASATTYVPLGGRAAVVVRGIGVLTRRVDDDGDGAIPFFYLPVLDDRVATAFRQDRLTGRDLVAVGAGVRLPVLDALGLYGVDALVMGYLGNVYDDVFDQFEASVSFEERAEAAADGHAPLRPSLALGLSLVDLRAGRMLLGGVLGVGPGGVTAASLQVTYDLRDVRPLFR
ncbi:hypothetical protein RQM47_12780 [Rubrivirga sp. S365]|uniref:Bacterial surface antigen (D15) domain-containing protein n=1 Tax=Rubrivirga litoralis TaxID=3075598 RepID=A0ABU3BMJ4_9BACT|nr:MULTISPECIES: hypothetical protein [unclassified Rubrivirga]MDT0630503.1 hypothetical protein [Rubrivirga sp. F394]MDT7857519.1 hypothetical protein [Rubrivirga sp. S365]